MTTTANKRHTMRVHKDGETMHLTFANERAAWDAYSAMPASVSCDMPQAEQHAVFNDAAAAVDSVSTFFHI